MIRISNVCGTQERLKQIMESKKLAIYAVYVKENIKNRIKIKKNYLLQNNISIG